MSSSRRRTLTGLGVGLVAAGATAAAGVATDRLVRARSTAKALGDTDSYDVSPTRSWSSSPTTGCRCTSRSTLPEGADPVGDVVPTVVLSHGYTLSLRSWVFQRRALTAAGYRVVVWDQRGHGRSGRAPRSRPPSTSSAVTWPASWPRPRPRGRSCWSGTPWAA